MTNAASWKFDWITDWETIWSESFQKQWMGWMEADAESHVFFHPALVKAWVETYLPLRRLEPRFLVARRGETTVFLPLVLWRRNWKYAWQRLLIPAGYSDFDYHDPIWVGPRGAGAEEGFWRKLASDWEEDGVPGDRIHITGLRERQVFARLGYETAHEAYCPRIRLGDFASIEDYKNSLRPKLRSELNRRKRRIEEQGHLESRTACIGDLTEIVRELGEMLEIHARRWPQAYKAPGFHESLIRRGLEANILHYSRMVLSGNSISWRIGFHWKETYYSYMPVFRQELAKYSPGLVHLLFCIEWAIANQCQVYDQLQGQEEYKSDWCTEEVEISSLSLKKNHIAATIRNYMADALKPGVVRHFRKSAAQSAHLATKSTDS